MATLTSRQAHILRIVLKLRRPNVNDLVHNEESPTRLKANLEQLVDKRCLRMEPQGNRHHYTITRTGLQHLAKYEADTADSSIGALIEVSQATADLQFQRVHDQIKGLAEQRAFPIPLEEWEKHKAKVIRSTHLSAKEDEVLWKHPYLTQKGKVDELVKISHALFFKMERPPQYDSTHYEGAYISAHDGSLTILSRSLHDDMVRCDRMLRKILREGKKDPDKEMWLKELGAYQLYLSYRTSEVARAN